MNKIAKSYFLTLVLTAVCGLTGIAQSGSIDTIKTTEGPLIIRPVEHASLILTLNDKNIYVDPTGGAEAFKGMKPPDLILITDIHGDHYDPKTVAAVRTSNTTLIIPKAVDEKFREADKIDTYILFNGQQTEKSGVKIRAIPMYNLPESPNSRHTKGRGNGYVVVLGGKSIYISGDTGDIPEMRALKGIDIAFVCMNLPYTMNINQAASAVLEFKPGMVYPYHYRGQDGLSDVNAFKKLVNAGNPAIDVRLRNWYPAK